MLNDFVTNYSGVEENDEAASLIKDYADKDYLATFNSLEEVRKYVGGDPVVSKLGVVVKWVWNPTMHEWKKKVRIILDNKESGVTAKAERTHRSTLPRASNAIKGILGLMEPSEWEVGDDEEVELFIADVSDAFWLVPLHMSERRFFVARFRGRWYVFKRTA